MHRQKRDGVIWGNASLCESNSVPKVSARCFRLLALQLFVVVCFVNVLSHFACGDERPNFVIFVADDMAWDDCGAYGNSAIRTPNMDRLAAEGNAI